MKKLLVLTAIFTLIKVNSSLGDNCPKTLFNDLITCLNNNNVSFSYTYSGNTIYISGLANCPPGQIQSCIAQYNAQTNDCPDAPVVVNSTLDNSNNNYNSPGNPNQ